jgi:tetratricopeptide (TPR) repeat protein
MDWYELFVAGRNEEAKPLLEKEVASESAPGQATLFLGAVQTLLDQDRRHLDAAAEAARSNVPEEFWLSLIGSTLWEIGFHEEGADRMRKAIVAHPTQENLALAADRFEKDLRYAREAIGLYDKILAEDPSAAPALVGRGSAKARLGEQLIDDAKRDFEAALKADPQEASAHYEMGNRLAFGGEYAEALAYFESAVKFGYWRLHCAHAGIAFCLQRLGRLEGAIRAARESLRIRPDYEYALTILKELGQAHP